jgi:hypothetical protein
MMAVEGMPTPAAVKPLAKREQGNRVKRFVTKG